MRNPIFPRVCTAGLHIAAAASAILASHPVAAADLVGTKPGVMCASPEALSKLTLPNGDSRTHAPAPKAEDLALAKAGGCIDIPPGLKVTVQKAFKNTSIVLSPASAGGTLVIPNIDFQAVTDTASAMPNAKAPEPVGYAMAQRLPVDGAGMVLDILEDQRITPALRRQMWNTSSDPAFVLPEKSPLAAEFERRPLLPAILRLANANGMLAERSLEQPLAVIEKAPLHGMPSPTFLLSVDYSTGMGSYSGPATQIIAPQERQLDPVQYRTDRNKAGGAIVLPQTLKAAWKLVPARAGGPEEIEAVSCHPTDGDQFVTTYRTYRFIAGEWRALSRDKAEFWESEGFPNRASFP